MNGNAGGHGGPRRRSRAHRAGIREHVSPSRQCRGGLRLAAVMAALTAKVYAVLASRMGLGSTTRPAWSMIASMGNGTVTIP
jgi:hypothetical protein